MKDKIVSFIKSEKQLILFFAIALAVHLVLPLNWADDEVFIKKAAETDIISFLNGSARPFTDGLTYIFIKNQWLWRILNPVVLTVLLYAFYKTAPVQCDFKKIFPVCLTAIFPTMVMVDAGFIATTVNYLWAVTFGILNFIPLINSYYDRKTNTFWLILLVPLLAYSTNMQQMCAVLLVIFIFANVFFIFKKSFKPYVFIQLLITVCGAVASLLFNFTGDNSRVIRETARYFPGFSELNLFEKVELGFSSTFYCMTMETRFAFFGFLVFAIFISVMIFVKEKPIYLKVISLVPIVFSFVFGIYSLIPGLNSTVLDLVTGEMRNYRLENAVYSFRIIPDVLFAMICCIMICCILSLIKNRGQKLFAICTFFLGLGSRMLMGFSPTVWASGYRTFCVMFISFVYIALIVYDNIIEKR